MGWMGCCGIFGAAVHLRTRMRYVNGARGSFAQLSYTNDDKNEAVG
jgi:hypothetical protein